MRVQQSIAAVICLLVLPACTAGPGAEDDTEVRGAQIERADTSFDRPAEDRPPEPDDDATRSGRLRITRVPTDAASPSAAPSPSPPPSSASPPSSAAPGQAAEPGGAAARPRQPRPPAAPGAAPGPPGPTAEPDTGSTDTSSTVVERPTPTARPPEPLSSGDGWGYASLLPHEDGSGWTETSATPPQDRSGDSGYRAFTTVATSPVEGAAGQLDVACPSWIAAPPDAGLRGSGTVTVELRAGDTLLGSAVHGVAVDLGPSERDPDLPWGSPVRVDAADGAAVTCTVRISA